MDPKYAGGGILLGDGATGSADDNSHVWAYRNVVLDTTNYGMAIAGGSDMRLYDNRIFSSGRLPDGRPILAQNVGLYIWNYSGAAAPLMQGNLAENNALYWTKWNSDGSARNNPWWLPDCTADHSSTCTGNVVPAGLPETVEAQELADWQARLGSQGLTAGPVSSPASPLNAALPFN